MSRHVSLSDPLAPASESSAARSGAPKTMRALAIDRFGTAEVLVPRELPPPSEIEERVEEGRRNGERDPDQAPGDPTGSMRQLKELQEAYGEAMLELRARKNCSLWRARTTNDGDDPPGTQSRRHPRLEEQAVPMIRYTAADRVLPADQGHDSYVTIAEHIGVFHCQESAVGG
jgi:hypothetical protein